jgi:hypothetical protein
MRLSYLLIWLPLLIIASSCNRAKEQPQGGGATQPATPSAAPIAATKEYNVTAQGEPYNLRFAGGALDFCDTRGGRELNLKTGEEISKDRTCTPKDEPNTACSGLSLDVEVRSPQSEPNDIVDVGGSSFPLNGRVHDCAADGKSLAVITASTTALIDTAKETTTQISPSGGDRVVLGSGWVAWTAGSNIHASVLK